MLLLRLLLPLAVALLGPASTFASFQEDVPPDAPTEVERPPLSLRVNHAISWGVYDLWQRQGKDGTWAGDESRFPGGLTAFVCFALVKSGVRRTDEDLQRALRALAEVRPESTYGAASRLFLYRALGEGGAQRSQVEEAANLLLAGQRQGLWGYPADPLDMSNTQFALLGLRAAHDLGFEVPEDALLRCLDAMLELQAKGGAFRYKLDQIPSQGMTAATLAGFAILDHFAEDGMGRLKTALRRADKARLRADTWMVENFEPARNALEDGRWTPGFLYATLWAIERYASLRSEKLLGEHDWYTEGAEWLLETQNVDGSWGKHEYQTCFALLFLRRATFSGTVDGELFAELDRKFQPRPTPKRKPAVDAAYLADWLVAGPFAGELGATGLFDPPFAPDKLRPKEGKKVGKRKFEACELKDRSWTDLEVFVNPPPRDANGEVRRDLPWTSRDHQLVVVATELVNEAAKGSDPTPVRLWFTLEDGWRIFLDGEEVSRGDRIAVPPPLKEDVVWDLRLPPGRTSLVVLVEDVYGLVPFGCRLTDPDGRVLPSTIRAEAPRK